MAKFVVLRVRTDRPGNHRHVSALAVEDDLGRRFVVTCGRVVKQLGTRGGDRYYAEADGERVQIKVIVCPRCQNGGYLTTDPAKSKANHLLSLRRF